jgi:hypothetical protein
MPTMPYDSIDSSVDAGEGWSTFGTRERGVMPMLQEGVNGLGALSSDPQGFRLLSNIDQRQIMEEIEENPAFGRKVTAALHRHGGHKALAASAKRAILNELNHKEHPESKGEWVTMRRRLRVLLRDLPAAINKQVDSMTLRQKTAALMALARGGAPNLQLGAEAPVASSGSMWGDVIGSVVKAAAGIYTAKLDSSTQKSISKINYQSEAAQAAGAAQIAQAQAALAAAQAAQAAQASGGWGGGGGGGSTLLWAVPAGLGVLGLIVYLVMKKS